MEFILGIAIISLPTVMVAIYSFWQRDNEPVVVTTAPPEPAPEPSLTVEAIERGDIDNDLRRFQARRMSGWDLHWDPQGGMYGAYVGPESMRVKLAAERRILLLATPNGLQNNEDHPS